MSEINENLINESFGENPAPMEGAPTPPNLDVQPPAAEGQSPELYEYNARGQTVKEDLDTILKRASMGYDYAQNMQSFKQEKDKFQQTISEREARAAELESKWKQYDEYARTNPQWEEHVRTSWEQRQQQGFEATQAPSSTAIPPEVQSTIEKMNDFISNYQRSEEDAHLNKEIEAVKSQYPNLDFVSTDPNTGKSLEFSVLEHGKNHGINNFRAAFRDFYHDKLVIHAEEKAKENVASTIQSQNKAGFIAESATPMAHYQRQKSWHEMSMDDAINAGARELGLNLD